MQTDKFRQHQMTRERLRVLLVEDSNEQAELIREMLALSTHYEFELQHEPRLVSGLEWLRDHHPDLVLLDLNLPDSRGLHGIERIHEAAPGAPIIVLTNVEDEATALEALREGAEDYLHKRQLAPELLVRSMRYAVERARVDEALRESEERFALALAGANDGIWDWDIRRNRVYFSARCRSILDLPQEEDASMQAWFKRVHPEDLSPLKSAMDAHLQGKTAHFEHEHRIQRHDGGIIWVQSRGLAVRGPRGNSHRIAGSINDITRRKSAEERLIHDALHDALTRLPNRSLFLDRLEHAIRRYKRDPSQTFAVLFFDLDRFKNINDSLGHTIGDELLISVARRLETFLRSGDSLARLGGDEFAILLSDLGENRHVTMVAERIHELLMNVFVLQGNEVFTSASIGIALSGPHYERPEEMLRDADLAMYRAKASPGCSFEVFDSAMHESVLAQHRLEMDLRRAVERGEFFNYYQTIVSLDSPERIQGFESLLRWQHPSWGIMSPDSFLDSAEETGLIVPIGWQALEEACVQTRRWQQLFSVQPPLTVSVNISAKFFLHADFVGRIEDILKRTGLPSNCLRLEITEQTLMSHADEVTVSLKALRKLGIQLYIDDFGTGYSSLTYLQRFSYDSLKIDRSFVQEIGGAGDSGAIVRAIVALADSLDMRVIAEGVETAQQLEKLRQLNCREAQGFLFTRPMSATDMTDHLTEYLDQVTHEPRTQVL